MRSFVLSIDARSVCAVARRLSAYVAVAVGARTRRNDCNTAKQATPAKAAQPARDDPARVQAGARAAGDGSPQCDMRQARSSQVDVIHRYGELPVSKQAGPPIVYTSRYDVTMQRPDRLKVVMPGDGPASEFYYDGKAMMAYAPAEDLVAVADAPPTIDAALEAAYRTGRDLLSLRGSGCRGSLRGVDGRHDPRVLHRTVGDRGRHENGHGGLGQ